MRCIFWCLRAMQSTRIDHTVVSHPVRVFVCILAFSRSSFATEQFQTKLFEYTSCILSAQHVACGLYATICPHVCTSLCQPWNNQAGKSSIVWQFFQNILTGMLRNTHHS